MRRLLAGAAAAIAALAVAACATHPPPPLTPSELAPTAAMRDLPLFWAGWRFDGIPLTAADTPQDYNPSLGLRVYYGDCGKRPLTSTGGCTLPLEIDSVLYHFPPKASTAGLGPQRRTTVRGVPAFVFDGGKSIELFTGRSEVIIYTNSVHRARLALRALRTLNLRTVAAGITALPPPEGPIPLGPDSGQTTKRPHPRPGLAP